MMINNNITVQNNTHTGDIKVCVNYYFILVTTKNCDVCSEYEKLENIQKEKVIKFIQELTKQDKSEV